MRLGPSRCTRILLTARTVLRRLLVLSCVLLSSAAWAQQASGIAGVVRDTSGGVLPGVTVEAASPALIEKVRSVVTDGEGRFNIVDLRPGTYVVTFSLTGFNTFKRDGIALTAGFTATVNADMQVGALAETITVTGAAPLVDTQNVSQQKVVSAELLTALPTASKAIQNLVTLTPGMNGTADVGGSSGLYRSNGPRAATFHGKAGVKVLYDGMNILSSGGTGVSNGYLPNPAFAEESTVETGGISAENSGAGIVINQIPKTGANTFTFTASILATGTGLQSDNVTDELRDRGLTTTSKVVHLYDGNVTVGGPFKQDRLWFFIAGRMAGNQNTVVNVFFNKTPHSPFYTPDPDRPGYRKEWLKSLGSRLTWQTTQKTKVSGVADFQGFFNRGRGEFADPVSAASAYNLSPQGLFQITLNSVRTSKLLLEAGGSFTENRWPYPSPGDRFMRVNPDDINILELSTNFQYNAKQFYTNVTDQFRAAERFSVAYVTGSHAFKGGVQVEQGINNQDQVVHGNVNYAFLSGVPNRITEYATPYLTKNRVKADLGLYIQDQWTLKRLTFNYGLRFDSLNGGVPAQHLAATQFVPVARDFAPVSGLPRWTDLEPRMGMSYNLFGNGRTALKVSLGRYVEQMGAGIANDNNPIVASVLTVTRTWNDANRNYSPDCDLTNAAANGECGALSNVNFGKNNPNASRYSDAVLHGFGVRNYAWDFGTEVQHQIHPALSVSGGYYRNWAGNFRVQNNLAVTPADYDPYCVKAPVDARLPGGGGYQVCGLYDVAPAKFGLGNLLTTSASDYVAQTQTYGSPFRVNCGSPGSLAGVALRGNGTTCGRSDFFGVGFNTRFGRGIQLGGGVDTGRTVTDNCLVIDSPQQLLNCHVVTPFKAQTQIKAFGTYPLPADFSLSATFQNLSGAPYEANYPASNAEIAPSLGRNLAACGTGATCTATTTVPVPLIPPMTVFLPRRTQLDLRLTKTVRLGPKARLQANVDIYNALNGSSLIAANSTYGPRWLQPASDNAIGGVDPILPGRLFQFGGRMTF
ncbi:MAG: hypothetical protein DMF92_06095 [Acidobacteria bacterium]|nr:MAG: hypothetical protein DMF92_06095 [Acidobacteriota bacterium]